MASRRACRRGFDVRGVRPPTVPDGTARLRISLTLNVEQQAISALSRRSRRAGRRGVTVAIVVTGTDTEIGKTVFSAGLARFLDGYYWKPVQAGLEDETDPQVVRRLADLAGDRMLPEAGVAHPGLPAPRRRE